MIIGQLLHLLARGIDKALFIKTNRDAPEARHALNVAVAMVVCDVDPLAAFNDQWTDLSVGFSVGVAVKMIGNVTCFVRIWSHIHGGHHFLKVRGLGQ